MKKVVKSKVAKKKEDVTLKISGHSAILVFDLDERQEEFEQARDAGHMAAALSEIQNEVWRPSYKHGYSDENIRDIIEKINSVLEKTDLKEEDGSELRAESLISALMDKYYSIITEWNVSKYT